MLRAMHSPDANDARLRQLLDERSARADPLGRYSTYSEASDSPSVYSRAFFSPRQTDEPHADAVTTDDYPFNSPTSHHLLRRPFDDPSSSVLDLGEDVRSSMVLSGAYDHDPEDDKRSLDDDSDEDSLPRMSYLGPKMRFHSRAPWELEEETLQEVDETESTGHGSFIGMFIGSRGKAHKTDVSSSSRPSTATGRPSVESSRSFLNSKRSFDTATSATHPRGALYALAQESLSTSSLGRSHHSGRQDAPRGKFSFGRLQSHSTNVDMPSSPDGSAIRLPSNEHSSITPPSPRASCDTTSSTLDIQAGLSAMSERRPAKGIHPYANPDLVVSYSEPPQPKSPILVNPPYQGSARKDSNTTVVESLTSIPAKSLTKSAPTPETATLFKQRISHIQGKDISSPVSVLSPESPIRPQFDEPASALPPGANSIPGWTDRNIKPGFSLISLEEARAQRMRAASIQPPPSHSSSSSGDSSTMTAVHNGAQDASTALGSAFSVAPRSEFAAARVRTRSISAGAKAKNTLQSFIRQPERRGSENGLVTSQTSSKETNVAPGKSLKHKKSGFMRLFGGGRVDEKDAPPVPQPPSVPSLPQQAETTTSTFTPRYNPKLSSHRIPVPSLSPSLLEAIARHECPNHLSDLSTDSTSRPGVSPKRTPHALSISTGSSPAQISPRGHFAGTFNDSAAPQSAPPNVSDFPALKLRPVSTLFNADFSNHLDVTKLTDNVGQKDLVNREVERSRQDSFASGSSGPSSASTPSFMDSQYNLSPIASSYAGTSVTTPTTGGIMSPTSTTGPWGSKERDYGLGGGSNGGNEPRFSVDQQSAPPAFLTNSNLGSSHHVVNDSGETATTIKVLQEHLDNTNKMWQKRVWDLENEIRSLKNELAELKMQEPSKICDRCSAGDGSNGVPSVPPLLQKLPLQQQQQLKPEGGVINRPRARTGGSSRFVNGQL